MLCGDEWAPRGERSKKRLNVEDCVAGVTRIVWKRGAPLGGRAARYAGAGRGAVREADGSEGKVRPRVGAA